MTGPGDLQCPQFQENQTALKPVFLSQPESCHTRQVPQTRSKHNEVHALFLMQSAECCIGCFAPETLSRLRVRVCLTFAKQDACDKNSQEPLCFTVNLLRERVSSATLAPGVHTHCGEWVGGCLQTFASYDDLTDGRWSMPPLDLLNEGHSQNLKVAFDFGHLGQRQTPATLLAG